MSVCVSLSLLMALVDLDDLDDLRKIAMLRKSKLGVKA